MITQVQIEGVIMKKYSIKTEYIIRNKVLEEIYDIIAIMGSEKPRLMIREEGDSLYTFEINPLMKLTSEITENHNIGNNKAMVTKILNLLKIHKFIDEREYFTHDLWSIPFKNGYYDVRANEFKENKYKIFFYQIPHDYNEDFKE
ncbi:hypothetical protein ES703_15263 [subsurface metagenome]